LESREVELKVRVEIPEELLELLKTAAYQNSTSKSESESEGIVYLEAPPKAVVIGHKIILERRPGYKELAEKIQAFTRLEEANEDVFTFLVNRMSLWKAAEAGLSSDEIVEFLKVCARSPPKPSLRNWIHRVMATYGVARIVAEKDYNVLEAVDADTMARLLQFRDVKAHLYRQLTPNRWRIKGGHRADLKKALLEKGYPVKDHGIFEEFPKLKLEHRPDFQARDYQEEALNRFTSLGGGVVILPPGTGKTVIAVMATVALKAPTLVISNRAQVCEQFRREYLEKTTVRDIETSVIHGGSKQRYPKPITLTTYQMASGSSSVSKRIWEHKWGLIVYDEVQHVPATLWSRTAEIQATRRLGLTATPVREDRQEKQIFSLIGPPIMDRGWLEMAEEGFIAEVDAYEVRVGISKGLRQQYEKASDFNKVLLTANNPSKVRVVKKLLDQYWEDQVLIIGFYLEGAKSLGEQLGIPVITGETSYRRRDELYQAFRGGELKHLLLTSVGEEGIDLPNAQVGVNIAGLYGSRMGFSQRFGRVLRPKEGRSKFYELVTVGTVEEEYSERRRTYLLSKGYSFETIDMTEA
jgi:DNA excision repair protein ERCC-3